MDKTKKNNRPLILSIISITICLVLLIGATIAWFTDTETNKGNVIQSGDLDIDVVWYDMTAIASGKDTNAYDIKDSNDREVYSVSFSTTENNFATAEDPMIEVTNWQSGEVEAKLIKVTNNGSLGVNITLNAVVEDLGLEDALWYDFIAVDTSNTSTTGSFTVRAMSTLSDFVSSVPFSLAGKTEDATSTLEFILIYGMLESAGNTYQTDADETVATSFTADIIVTATQTNTTEETVVYAYKASDITGLTADDTNKTIILMDDITVDGDIDLKFNVNFDLNGYTLAADSFTMYTEDYCTVDIANGTIKSTGDYDVQIKNGTVNVVNTTVYSGGDIIFDATINTLNLTGTTAFLTLDAKKATVTIMDDTRVVVDTDSSVSLQADTDATVTVVDGTTGNESELTEDPIEVSATTAVSTVEEFVTAMNSKESLSLTNDLTINMNNYYNYGAKSYLLIVLMQDFGLDIDLNGYTLTIESPTYTTTLNADKTFNFKNGTLILDYKDGTATANSAFSVAEGAVLTFENVDYSTNATAIYVTGPSAVVNITDSTITAPYYCIGTNGSVTKGYDITCIDSIFNGTETDGIPVMVNAEGTISLTGCIVNSQGTGMMVRGGTATIIDTTINAYYQSSDLDKYLSTTWGSGTNVPFAGLLLGCRGGTSYAYDTNCTLENVTINLTGADSYYAVYAWGHDVTDVDLTLTYDSDCEFDGNVYVGGVNVTINDNKLTNLPTDEAVVY